MDNQIQAANSYAIAFTRSETRSGTTNQMKICRKLAEQLGVQIAGWHKAEGSQSTVSEAFPIVMQALHEARITLGVQYFITPDCSTLTHQMVIFGQIGQSLGRQGITLATQDGIISFKKLEA